MSAQNWVAEALRQAWEGDDFMPAGKLLSRITPVQAARRLDGAPYSLLTNVAHAEFWQRLWLARLKNLRRPKITDDWRVPQPEEWPQVRSDFLSGFAEALEIARSKPFRHEMKSDVAARKTLLKIALHNSYHLGQMRLLKR